ncbi:MAG: polysaccharide biosynthesis tyrosine autokinase [Verrucomicrobiota bacterium]
MSYDDYQEDSYGNANPQASRGLKDYFRWFLRRFWIFLLCLLGGFFLGLYIYSNTPETYQSYATIEIKRSKQEAADVDDSERIRMTGIGEILSASEKLKMPSLYTDIAASHLFANREGVVRKEFNLPWEESFEDLNSADLSAGALGGMMQSWVSVRWREDTTLMDVIATHSSPEIARDVLVGLLSEYERSVESKVAGSSEDALEYILNTTDEIKAKLLALEKTNRLYNRCIELSLQIRESETRINEMEKRYLPKWPPLVEAKELARILREKFASELQQVLRVSEEERKFWEENESVLAGLDEKALTNAQIQLVSTRSSVLAREIEVEQQMFDNLTTKLKEGNFSKGYATKQFEVLQPPSLPTLPVGPDQLKILLKFTAGGGALGIAIIFLIGFLDPTVRTVSDLELLSAVPVIGAIPVGKFGKDRSDALALLSDKKSQATEAIRTLRAGLTFLGDTDERCTFLITSALPGEGKSWVASNLALAFATQGDRTLMIDADLRRPVQNETFGYDGDHKGLTDHLSLGESLKEVIQKTQLSENLFLMSAGSRSANPAELLAGKQLPGLLDKLSEYFDRIIIDSAPLIPVSDTFPLVRLAQSVVLVCRIGKTPSAGIKRAIRIIGDNGKEPVGIVANGLPRTRSKRAYGYYYSYMGGGNYSYYNGEDSEDDIVLGRSAKAEKIRRSRSNPEEDPTVSVK